MHYGDGDIYIIFKQRTTLTLKLLYIHLTNVSSQNNYKKYIQVAGVERLDEKSDGSVKYFTCSSSFSKPTMHAGLTPIIARLLNQVSVNTMFLMINELFQPLKRLYVSSISSETAVPDTQSRVRDSQVRR